MNENELKNRRFVIIEACDDFIQCRGIYTNFARAIGEAYLIAEEIANEDATDKGKISEMLDLEMDTGFMFIIEFKDYKKQIYVLDCNDDEKVK